MLSNPGSTLLHHARPREELASWLEQLRNSGNGKTLFQRLAHPSDDQSPSSSIHFFSKLEEMKQPRVVHE